MNLKPGSFVDAHIIISSAGIVKLIFAGGLAAGREENTAQVSYCPSFGSPLLALYFEGLDRRRPLRKLLGDRLDWPGHGWFERVEIIDGDDVGAVPARAAEAVNQNEQQSRARPKKKKQRNQPSGRFR